MTSYQFLLFKIAFPFAIALFFASSVTLIWLCWSPELGPISEHRAAMVRAIIKAMQQDLSTARAYGEWLRRHELVLMWLAHVALPVLVGAGLGGWFFAWYMSQSEVRHLCGPLPLDERAAVRHAHTMYRREVGGSRPGLSIHPHVRLTEKRELGNFLVTGVAGAGKSVIEKPLVAQLIRRGDRALIYDQKSEYLPLFYDPQNAVIINPLDIRSHIWDLANDCPTEEAARMIAENFLPMAADEKNPIWTNGARAILAGAMITLLNQRGAEWGWPELRKSLSGSDGDLHHLLLPHAPEAAQLIDPSGTSQTTRSYRSTILSALAWLPTMARAWPRAGEKRFSIRQWMADSNSQRVIIVPNSPEFSAISAPLCAALISLLVTRVLTLPDSDDRRIWLILDELANLPKSTSILRWLELGRSKGARMLAGFQSYSQIQEIYGEKAAQTILGLFHSIVSMRCGQAGGSSEIVSRAFGQRQVKRLSLTDSGSGTSTTWHTVDEPVVRAEELEHLPQPDKLGVTGYISVAGWNAVYRLTWPYNTPLKIAPEFVEAAWVRGSKKQKISAKLIESSVTNKSQKNRFSATEDNQTLQPAASKSRLRRSPAK